MRDPKLDDLECRPQVASDKGSTTGHGRSTMDRVKPVAPFAIMTAF